MTRERQVARVPSAAARPRARRRSSSTSSAVRRERVGGDAAVVQVQRGAGDAVDLGDQRRARELGAAVEGGEAGEGADVVGEGMADDDVVAGIHGGAPLCLVSSTMTNSHT